MGQQKEAVGQEQMVAVLRHLMAQERMKPEQLADQLHMTNQMIYRYLSGGQKIGHKGLARLLTYAPQYSLDVVSAMAGLSPADVVRALLSGPHRQLIIEAGDGSPVGVG